MQSQANKIPNMATSKSRELSIKSSTSKNKRSKQELMKQKLNLKDKIDVSHKQLSKNSIISTSQFPW